MTKRLRQVPTPAERTPRDEARRDVFGRTSLLPFPDKMRLERGNVLLNAKEKSLDLREKLEGRLLVGDGAMGTLLADRESNSANI